MSVLILVGYLGRELILHLKEILADGLQPCLNVLREGVIELAGILAGTLTPTVLSIALVSSIVIPVTTVSIYTIFRKTKEKPKALIVAIGLFLDPLFIDFFKDEFGKENALRKILVSAFGVVTFLAAAYFWSKATEEEGAVTRKAKVGRALTRMAAVILFLLPTLAILGYIAATAHSNWNALLHSMTLEKSIGLVGLLAVAVIGISLSRYFEGP